MRYFYVDTENFNDYNFINNWNIGKYDTIIFFTSENSGNIKLKLLSEISSNKATIVFEDVVVGEKNAMDSQIIACLSLNIAINKNYYTEHYIVSDDKDYHFIISYLHKKFILTDIYIIKPRYDNVLCNLINEDCELNSLLEYINNKIPQISQKYLVSTYKNKFLVSKYDVIIKNKKEDFFNNIINLCEKHKENDLKLYRKLKRKYGNTNGVNIYKIYKNELKDKNNEIK